MSKKYEVPNTEVLVFRIETQFCATTGTGNETVSFYGTQYGDDDFE